MGVQKVRKTADDTAAAMSALKLDPALSASRSNSDPTAHDPVTVQDILAVHYVVVAHLRFDITVQDLVVTMAKTVFKCLTKEAALSACVLLQPVLYLPTPCCLS